MRKLAFIFLSTALITVSCGDSKKGETEAIEEPKMTPETEQQDQVIVNEPIVDPLEEYWTAFQGALEVNNLDVIISMSEIEGIEETTEEHIRNNFDMYFDEEARKQIAAATVDDFIDQDTPEGSRAYSFTVHYVYDMDGEEMESATIFYFAMVEGQFKLISVMMAG